jgi:hypothetical protein
MAGEFGASIGRSAKRVAFMLGAGASLSSKGPTTRDVEDAFRAATSVRFEGMDLLRAIALLEDEEKQEILAPLFHDVHPGLGYYALAGIAAYKPVVVLNLNWDRALAEAAARSGVLLSSFDIKSDPGTWPDVHDTTPGLHDVHLHGMIGESCRFGTLETLEFSEAEAQLLVDHGLRHVFACLGASVSGENDLPALFRRHELTRGSTKPNRHWYFIRGDGATEGDDLFREAVTHGSPIYTVKDLDLDFDRTMLAIADAATAELSTTPEERA